MGTVAWKGWERGKNDRKRKRWLEYGRKGYTIVLRRFSNIGINGRIALKYIYAFSVAYWENKAYHMHI